MLDDSPCLTRRFVLTVASAALVLPPLSGAALAQSEAGKLFQAELARLLAGRTATETGVKIDAPALAENGLAVPVTIEVESLMAGADHIKTIHLLTDGNPQPVAARFHLSAVHGRAAVSTRVRLVQSQTLVAVAETSMGDVRIARAEVTVTVGACDAEQTERVVFTTLSARIRVPPIAKKGEIIEVKTLIPHDMESGQRKDAEGRIIARKILHRFEARFNGDIVFSADWHPGIAANPYQSFFLKATQSGELTFIWVDDDGTVTRAAAALTVA